MKVLQQYWRFRFRRGGATHIFPNGAKDSLCQRAKSFCTAHAVPSKKHPICKKCEKIATEQKLWANDIKVEPCPKCGNEGIYLSHCGYSSFNPGGGECKDCGFKVQEYVEGDITDGDLAKLWNKGVRAFNKSPQRSTENKLKAERAKTRKLRAQLRKLGEEPAC